MWVGLGGMHQPQDPYASAEVNRRLARADGLRALRASKAPGSRPSPPPAAPGRPARERSGCCEWLPVTLGSGVVLCAAVYECVAAPSLATEPIAGPEFRLVLRGSCGRPGGLSAVRYRLEEA